MSATANRNWKRYLTDLWARMPLAGRLTLIVGFCAGLLVEGLASGVGVYVWFVSWAVAACFYFGGRRKTKDEDLTERIRETAEYDAALEAARAELARLESQRRPDPDTCEEPEQRGSPRQ